MKPAAAGWSTTLARLLALLVVCALALQLYFLIRVGSMRLVDPQSTTFQRSEAWRLLSAPRSGLRPARSPWGSSEMAKPYSLETSAQPIAWRQRWVPYERISAQLKRAVIASEDARFADHSGVEWDALEKAWERNQQAESRSEKIREQLERRAAKPASGKAAVAAPAAPQAEPKIVGGSTITQQLAKNLFLGSERSWARKGQEFAVTVMLEAMLPKQRILEIYLNNVEWGEGVFGAEAAAQHYFQVDAGRLGALQAARLAVMLPAPKRFEKRPGSAYVVGRAGTVAARMASVEPP